MLKLGKGKVIWRHCMDGPDKFFRLQEKEGSSIFRVDSKYLRCERYTGLRHFTECSMDCFFDREERMLYYIKEESVFYA
jgi:hypothetical protein